MVVRAADEEAASAARAAGRERKMRRERLVEKRMIGDDGMVIIEG